MYTTPVYSKWTLRIIKDRVPFTLRSETYDAIFFRTEDGRVLLEAETGSNWNMHDPGGP